MKQTLTTIMYHYVRELINSKHPNIKALLTSEFEDQLSYLNKQYTFVGINDCINAVIHKE